MASPFMENITAEPFAKGSFVLIYGLTSEAGKKLNGGVGIVLGPASKDPKGEDRLPVRVFAILETDRNTTNIISEGSEVILRCPSKVLLPCTNHKVKLCNLKETDLPLTSMVRSSEDFLKDKPVFEVVARAQVAVALRNDDRKAQHFWLQQLNNHFPQLVDVAVAYASHVKKGGKDAEAADIISRSLPFLDESLIPEKALNGMLSSACKILSNGTKKQLQQAFDCLMKIPTDTDDSANIFEDAAHAFSAACNNIQKKQRLTEWDQDVARIDLEAAKALYDIRPDHVDCVVNVGVSYSRIGDWVQSAKYLRRGLDIMNSDANASYNSRYTVKHVQHLAIGTQLRIPGMPLEHFAVLWTNVETRESICLRVEHRDRVEVTEDGFRVDQRNPPEFMRYQFPKSVDDEDIFPPCLLKKIQWDGK